MKQLLLTGLVALSLPALAQTGNKIKFNKGATLEVSTQLTTTTKLEVMGQSMETKATSGVTQTYMVTGASNGNTTMEHHLSRIQFNANSGMGQDISFDSDKPEDKNSEIGKQLQKTLASKYVMTVDPYGMVVSVKADSASTSGSDGAAMLLSQIDVGTDVPKAGDATIFKVLPNHPVKKGESWTDSSSNESGKRVVNYTVSNITPTEVILTYTENATLQTTQQVMGFDTKISSTSTGTGKVVVDKATGLLKEKTDNVDSKENIEAQGQSMPATSKRVVVTKVAEKN